MLNNNRHRNSLRLALIIALLLHSVALLLTIVHYQLKQQSSSKTKQSLKTCPMARPKQGAPVIFRSKKIVTEAPITEPVKVQQHVPQPIKPTKPQPAQIAKLQTHVTKPATPPASNIKQKRKARLPKTVKRKLVKKQAHKKTLNPPTVQKPIQQKKRLTLAQLTQAMRKRFTPFRQAVVDQHKGSAQGDVGGDLKLAVYSNKVLEALSSACLGYPRAFIAVTPGRETGHMSITIDKNGSIVDIAIYPRFASEALQKHLKRVLYSAQPLPPLPSHIPNKTFKHNFTVDIDHEEGPVNIIITHTKRSIKW